MNKQTKNAVVVLGVLGIFILGYFGYEQMKAKKNRKIVITYLDNLFPETKHTDFVNSADKKYINAWASAITENKPNFIVNGEIYNTNGGTKK